jgi:cation diffusion facilitator CzcD-associated flavoprotein CzcO
MAIDLIRRNQCHNFIIVEKSSSIGGTWQYVWRIAACLDSNAELTVDSDNKYPGCCCDGELNN